MGKKEPSRATALKTGQDFKQGELVIGRIEPFTAQRKPLLLKLFRRLKPNKVQRYFPQYRQISR
jgi:hypothetical protein